jgi:hypothetical protein
MISFEKGVGAGYDEVPLSHQSIFRIPNFQHLELVAEPRVEKGQHQGRHSSKPRQTLEALTGNIGMGMRSS